MRKVENNICFTGKNWNNGGCVKKKENCFIYYKYLLAEFVFPWKAQGHFIIFVKLFWYLK